ncbi:MAG TPA: hypothetical protein VGL68_02515 [Solirubrobacteraceae bacterium]|jgi:hypothetical protein
MRSSIRLLALVVGSGAWAVLAGGISAVPALGAPAPEIPEMRAVQPVTNVTARTAVVHGVLDPKAASPEAHIEYDFFYGGGVFTCDEAGSPTAPQTPGVASGAQGEPVETSLSGLAPDTEYSVCLGARNTGGTFELSELSAPVQFKTAAVPPDVVSESVAERWATAVLLQARINNEGEPTECFFQYGEASISEHEVSCGGIGGEGELTLSAKVEGLASGHTYHWRTVAKNDVDTIDGMEASFTTPEPSIALFTWSPGIGVPVTVPANANGEPKALFDWGACSTAGYCAGVGAYRDENGNEEAMAATRVDGSWGQAVEIALPAGAVTSGQEAGFGFAAPSVACTAPGDCVAVGHYIKAGGDEEAMTVTETGGVWGAASETKLPADAAGNPDAVLASVTCSAAGSCVASGQYKNAAGYRVAMIANDTGGSWGPANEIELPANADNNAGSHLSAIACSTAGSCVGIGEYRDGSTAAEEAMVVSETAGKWARASQIALPANAGDTPRSVFNSVACVPSGECVAVGSYVDRSGGREAMVADETGGIWGTASEIQAPSNAAVNPEIAFGFAPISITCVTSGSCILTAQYTDSSGDREAMVAEETSGVWSTASEIQAPSNTATNPRTMLYPACPTAGACVLVGEYTDAEARREAMVTDRTGGSWSQASEVVSPANAGSNPGVTVGEVQCPAGGSCLAFGEYTSSTGETRDMEVTGLAAPENKVAPNVSGTAEVGQVLTCSQGTWITPDQTSYSYRWLRDGAAIGGVDSSVYTVTAADEGHSISCEVTATDAAGSKSAVSAGSVAIREEAKERREAEAAAKRRQEEALVAKKQEEAAAKETPEEAKIAIASSVSLAGSVLNVQSGGKTLVKLICMGTAPCTGKLTLTVTVKGKGNKHDKKIKAETIGRAAFSLPTGKTGVVTIKLTAGGRALLQAAHGKLSASLAIVKSSPSPTSTKREGVQLVQKKATQGKKRKG